MQRARYIERQAHSGAVKAVCVSLTATKLNLPCPSSGIEKLEEGGLGCPKAFSKNIKVLLQLTRALPALQIGRRKPHAAS